MNTIKNTTKIKSILVIIILVLIILLYAQKLNFEIIKIYLFAFMGILQLIFAIDFHHEGKKNHSQQSFFLGFIMIFVALFIFILNNQKT